MGADPVDSHSPVFLCVSVEHVVEGQRVVGWFLTERVEAGLRPVWVAMARGGGGAQNPDSIPPPPAYRTLGRQCPAQKFNTTSTTTSTHLSTTTTTATRAKASQNSHLAQKTSPSPLCRLLLCLLLPLSLPPFF